MQRPPSLPTAAMPDRLPTAAHPKCGAGRGAVMRGFARALGAVLPVLLALVLLAGLPAAQTAAA